MSDRPIRCDLLPGDVPPLPDQPQPDSRPERPIDPERLDFNRDELATALHEEDCFRVGVPPFPVHLLTPVHWRSLLRRADRIFYFQTNREKREAT